MEKLQPQDRLPTLVGQTISNYEVARSYYSQRRLAFKSFLEKNYISALSFENDLNLAIEKIWNKKIRGVLAGIYFNNKNVDDRVAKVREQFNTSPYLDKMIQAVKHGNPKNFWLSLGFVFEDFISDTAMDPIIKTTANFGSKHADSLINAFVSGAMKSTASAVSGVKNIRPDVIIAPAGMTFKMDENKVLRESNTSLPLEMQGNLQIDWTNVMPKPEDILESSNLLQRFLEDSNFYGFSAKTWKAGSTDGKGFMQSSVMQKSLNSIFNQVDSNGNRHPWEIDYTSEYVAYQLSRNIFHIVGPTNIAMVTGGGIIWMDNFLSSHLFYMRVQIDNELEDNRFFPQVNDSHIYVRNYNNKFNIIKSARHKTQQDRNYIDLKLDFQ